MVRKHNYSLKHEYENGRRNMCYRFESGYKREFVIDYIDDTDESAMDIITSLLD